MTALVWRGKCLRMRPGKGSFPGVACSPDAKPAPSGAAARTGDPNRLKSGRPAYTGVGSGESKRKSWLNQEELHEHKKLMMRQAA
jgi:hypothetical protein